MDRYTKIALTVIAMALSVIAGQGLLRPARAQLGGVCGDRQSNVCYVEIVQRRGTLSVSVDNTPLWVTQDALPPLPPGRR